MKYHQTHNIDFYKSSSTIHRVVYILMSDAPFSLRLIILFDISKIYVMFMRFTLDYPLLRHKVYDDCDMEFYSYFFSLINDGLGGSRNERLLVFCRQTKKSTPMHSFFTSRAFHFLCFSLEY